MRFKYLKKKKKKSFSIISSPTKQRATKLTVHFYNRILNLNSIEASRRSVAPKRGVREACSGRERDTVLIPSMKNSSIEEPRGGRREEARVSHGQKRRRRR